MKWCSRSSEIEWHQKMISTWSSHQLIRSKYRIKIWLTCEMEGEKKPFLHTKFPFDRDIWRKLNWLDFIGFFSFLLDVLTSNYGIVFNLFFFAMVRRSWPMALKKPKKRYFFIFPPGRPQVRNTAIFRFFTIIKWTMPIYIRSHLTRLRYDQNAFNEKSLRNDILRKGKERFSSNLHSRCTVKL